MSSLTLPLFYRCDLFALRRRLRLKGARKNSVLEIHRGSEDDKH
ncbi:hypothetical protein FG05_35061 [Fusarium graminearum]|nr:hypothetical protein FG05_35061 [Fusarium graminearum]